MTIDRRVFIRGLAMAGLAGATSNFLPTAFAQTNYSGKLLITLQLRGALDVTSFCDPKENVVGELEINHWARTKSIQQAGNILFAPYATNRQFFEKYKERILIINGVDAQTNSHDAGEITNWSGRLSLGYPTLTALMSSINAPDLALSYLNFGGFGSTESLIRSTRIDSPREIRNLLYPNVSAVRTDRNYIPTSDWDLIQAMHHQNMQSKVNQSNLPARDKLNRQYYMDAFTRADSIKAFGSLLPGDDQLQAEREINNKNKDISKLHQQIQITLLAFKSGLTIASDLEVRGYDTHDEHDANHEALLIDSLDAIDYLWEYAEELGLADRILLVVGSDFGRTPHYNSAEGKDHWPIGSFMMMEKNAKWSNRVVGETDEGHNALAINPATLNRDAKGGSIIYTKHIHKALRKYLGIDNHSIAQRFPFNNTEDFKFFS